MRVRRRRGDRLPGRRRAPGRQSTLTANEIGCGSRATTIDCLLAEGDAANQFTGAPVEGRRPETTAPKASACGFEFRDKELAERDRHRRREGRLPQRERPRRHRRRGARPRRVRGRAHHLRGAEEPDPPRGQGAPRTTRTSSLRSPEVVFDSKKRMLEARGNPMLEDAGDTLPDGRCPTTWLRARARCSARARATRPAGTPARRSAAWASRCST